jgi:HemY protein
MRAVLWLILIFILAVASAMIFGTNDGLVSFYWRGWRADLSLNFFLLASGTVIFATVCALYIGHLLTSLPRRAHQWREHKAERALYLALEESLTEYWAGRYTRSAKAARKAQSLVAQLTDKSFVHAGAVAHLLAARALHRIQNHTERDAEIQSLETQYPSTDASPNTPFNEALQLLKVEWALDQGSAHTALELMEELPSGLSRRTLGLRLRLQAQQLMQQHEAALQTAQLLLKHGAFSAEAGKGLIRSLIRRHLQSASSSAHLSQLWKKLDTRHQRDPDLIAYAAQCCATFNELLLGRQWLKPAFDQLLEHAPDSQQNLVYTLIKLMQGLEAEWLPSIETALLKSPRSPHFSALATLAFFERQLYGKAQNTLMLALELPQPAWLKRKLYFCGAALCLNKEDQTEALNYYQKAAQLDGAPRDDG